MSAITLHDLAEGLLRELHAGFGPEAPNLPERNTALLRSAFRQFGWACQRERFPLPDSMAAGVDVLQTVLERSGSGSVTLAAGVALAGLSEGYHEARDQSRTSQPEPEVPRPWIEALHRVNSSANAKLDLAHRLEWSVRLVADTIGADGCAISLYDESLDVLVLRAAVGLNPSAVGVLTTRPGEGITGLAARERQQVVAEDAKSHPHYQRTASAGEDIYATQVSVPLLVRPGELDELLIGVMTIFSVDRRTFTEPELVFLEALAGELAISIQNARLYSLTDAKLQQKIAELSTLQRVSHTIASNLELNDVLKSIAEQAVQLFDVEAAAIFRLASKRDGGEIGPTVEYRVGRARDAVDEATRDAAITNVVRTGTAQGFDVEYVDGDGRLFCIPLRSGRERLGALCLRLKGDSELKEDQLALLQAFSDSATLAIENATLYQEARQGYETASTLLQEMHHRVRNNLQTVAALLSLQLRKNEDAPWAGALREAIGRVQAIASIHDLLSDEARLGGTTADVIARHVASEAHRTLIPPGMKVSFDIPASDVLLPSKHATILALIINELVANAVRHGFQGHQRGHIRIAAEQQGGIATITVANDGERPESIVDPERSSGLGMRIIQRLATSDLGGTFTIEPGQEGAVATIRFPIAQEIGAAIG